jgi:hypothetical protein
MPSSRATSRSGQAQGSTLLVSPVLEDSSPVLVPEVVSEEVPVSAAVLPVSAVPVVRMGSVLEPVCGVSVVLLLVTGLVSVVEPVPDCDMLPAVGSSAEVVGSTVVGVGVVSPVLLLPELLLPAETEVVPPVSSPHAARRRASAARGRRGEARVGKVIPAG